VPRLKNISKLPGVLSSHTTYTLLPDAAICEEDDCPLFWLRLPFVL